MKFYQYLFIFVIFINSMQPISALCPSERNIYIKSYPFFAILGDSMRRGPDHRNEGFEGHHG
jgi:hypothetical protein